MNAAPIQVIRLLIIFRLGAFHRVSSNLLSRYLPYSLIAKFPADHFEVTMDDYCECRRQSLPQAVAF